MTTIPKLSAIWVYLAASPLLGLTITLIAYLIAQRVYSRAHFNPLANPVLIAVAILVILLEITKTPYNTYFEPPRVLWRLQLLREWSHEQEGNQVFPGSPRARSASGARAA